MVVSAFNFIILTTTYIAKQNTVDIKAKNTYFKCCTYKGGTKINIEA